MNDSVATQTSLHVEGLGKTYTSRAGEVAVLRDINLSLNGGDAIAITGPSGSGKSTLLNILGGLDRPTSGSVRVNGTDPFSMSEADLARFRNETIGFVFQDHHLLPQCTVLENVLLPTLAGPGVTGELEERARTLIERVGLSHRIGHRPAELSGGERQRVAIARAIIQRPALVLGDEPTGNLDRSTAQNITKLLLELYRETDAILILVTHSLELAQQLPKRYELNDGLLTGI